MFIYNCISLFITRKKDFFFGIVQPQGVRFDIGNPHTINTNNDHIDIFILGSSMSRMLREVSDEVCAKIPSRN